MHKEVLPEGEGTAEDLGQMQVHRFGSVPLKTYLPHGDLDVTAFSPDDQWLSKVCRNHPAIVRDRL